LLNQGKKKLREVGADHKKVTEKLTVDMRIKVTSCKWGELGRGYEPAGCRGKGPIARARTKIEKKGAKKGEQDLVREDL